MRNHDAGRAETREPKFSSVSTTRHRPKACGELCPVDTEAPMVVDVGERQERLVFRKRKTDGVPHPGGSPRAQKAMWLAGLADSGSGVGANNKVQRMVWRHPVFRFNGGHCSCRSGRTTQASPICRIQAFAWARRTSLRVAWSRRGQSRGEGCKARVWRRAIDIEFPRSDKEWYRC